MKHMKQKEHKKWFQDLGIYSSPILCVIDFHNNMTFYLRILKHFINISLTKNKCLIYIPWTFTISKSITYEYKAHKILGTQELFLQW